MTGPVVLPLAAEGDTVSYVVVDDEPRYRTELSTTDGQGALEMVGSYPDVESFLAIHRQPCHVIVLDLCLNRATGDAAVLQGVQAIRTLTGLGHRILVHTADERPEPVARCIAAGACGYVSKYHGDAAAVALAVTEIARNGQVSSPVLTGAIRELVDRCRDVRLSETVEETLVLLGRGLSDKQVAERRHISARTVEDHKRKILEVFGSDMEARGHGFAHLAHDLGVSRGDLVNDRPGTRPSTGLIRRALEGFWRRRPATRPGLPSPRKHRDSPVEAGAGRAEDGGPRDMTGTAAKTGSDDDRRAEHRSGDPDTRATDARPGPSARPGPGQDQH
ncbi:MAG: hypothetical protein QG597_1931 [Actinomycetota bacterium]|nr:hypothetical protein [Actinomycetota bacterium]